MKTAAGKGVLLFLLFVIVSCSGEPPRISRISWNRIVGISGNRAVSEGLSFFADVEDDDGKGDIESVYIINDSFEVFWKLTPETWSEKTVDSRLWIGSNAVRMPGGARLPSGTYRIVVIDKGGDRDEKEIFLPPLAVSEQLPSLEIVDGSVIRVRSPFKENYLWLKDERGNTVKVLKIVPGDTAKELALRGVKEKIASYVLYAFDITSNCGYTVSVPAE